MFPCVLDLVPLRGENPFDPHQSNKILLHVYLLGCFSKISDEHPHHFYMGVPFSPQSCNLIIVLTIHVHKLYILQKLLKIFTIPLFLGSSEAQFTHSTHACMKLVPFVVIFWKSGCLGNLVANEIVAHEHLSALKVSCLYNDVH